MAAFLLAAGLLAWHWPDVPARSAGWVDEQITAHRVRVSESPMDSMPWAHTFPEAMQRARAENRLVFLMVDRGDFLSGRA